MKTGIIGNEIKGTYARNMMTKVRVVAFANPSLFDIVTYESDTYGQEILIIYSNLVKGYIYMEYTPTDIRTGNGTLIWGFYDYEVDRKSATAALNLMVEQLEPVCKNLNKISTRCIKSYSKNWV